MKQDGAKPVPLRKAVRLLPTRWQFHEHLRSAVGEVTDTAYGGNRLLIPVDCSGPPRRDGGIRQARIPMGERDCSTGLVIRQKIIEAFDLHNRHDQTKAFLVMREVVYHRFVRNEPSRHDYCDIDRLTSRKSMFQLAPQRL